MAQGGSFIDISSKGFSNIPCNKQLFTGHSDSTIAVSKDNLEVDKRFKVYLRVKPLSSVNEKNVLQIVDDTSVVTQLNNDNVPHRRNQEETCRYTFSKIFGPDTSQKELFECSARELVKHFFNGNNCLLFTYGTSSAGKTYTVQGTKTHPGIIPRTLSAIFKTVRQGQLSDLYLKPSQSNSVLRLSKQQVINHNDLKNKIINNEEFQGIKTKKTDDEDCSWEVLSDAAIAFKKMEKVLDKEVERFSVDDNGPKYCELWVSFMEVYNEEIYDLLKPISSLDVRRRPLKLARDGGKNCYVKDLSYISVKNEEEAFKVYLYGRRNLQIASTGLNKHSSRSHCIFSIVLIKVFDPHSAMECQLSRFNICDLAGAERQKKTFNMGDRFVESKNINCSLHVLSRCFNILRENQLKNSKIVVPFRESKLTRLFQRAFNGDEVVTMIVNVSPDSKLFDETQQVLRISAVAKSITQVVRPANIKCVNRTKRFTTFIEQHFPFPPSMQSISVPDATGVTISSTLPTQTESNESQEIIESLMKSNELQKNKINELERKLREEKKTNLDMAQDIRTEVAGEFQKLYVNMKKKYITRWEEAEKELRELRLWKFRKECEMEDEEENKQMKKRKRIPFDCSVSMIEPLSDNNDANSKEMEELKTKLNGLKDRVEILTEQKKQLNEELSQIKFAMSKEKINYDTEKKMLQEKIKELEKNIEDIEKECKYKDQIIAEAMKEINIRESNEQQYQSQLEEANLLLGVKNTEIEELEKIINELQKDDLFKGKCMKSSSEGSESEDNNEYFEVLPSSVEKCEMKTSPTKSKDPIEQLKTTPEVNRKGSLSDSEITAPYSLRKRTTRRVLANPGYCSDNELGTPEDPKFVETESPLSAFNRIAPLSSKKPRSRRKKN